MPLYRPVSLGGLPAAPEVAKIAGADFRKGIGQVSLC